MSVDSSREVEPICEKKALGTVVIGASCLLLKATSVLACWRSGSPFFFVFCFYDFLMSYEESSWSNTLKSTGLSKSFPISEGKNNFLGLGGSLQAGDPRDEMHSCLPEEKGYFLCCC